MKEPSPETPVYPKLRLERRKAELQSRGLPVFDFGTGDPPEPTPEFVRQALIQAVPSYSAYPTVSGTDELREAAAGYVERRFGVFVDPSTEVLPTAGAKEAIFHLPMALIDPTSGRDLVVYGEPAYAVFAIAAGYAQAKPHSLTLTAEQRYLLTPEEVGEDALSRTAMVFLNYPHNPSGQEMTPEVFQRWVDARDEHGFVLVSDECYCDIYFGEPPHSLLEYGREGCLVIHSLSKRSGMTGYLSGFMTGDAAILETLHKKRQPMGLASPVWTQAAAAAAWREPEHVEERRMLFAEKRGILLELLESRGLQVYPSSSTLFLWARLPAGETDISYAERLLEVGIVVSPGTFFGEAQAGFVRVAAVPSPEDCRRAAEIWPAS